MITQAQHTEVAERQARAARASGTPFAILYQPKRLAPPPPVLTPKQLTEQRNRDSARARYHRLKETTTKVHLHSLSGTSKAAKPARKTVRHELTTPVNHHFCVKIAAQGDSDITNRIRGRGL